MVLHSLAQAEGRETPKDLSFTRLLAEIYLSAKLFVAQERASDDEDDDDVGDVRRFESDLRRFHAHTRCMVLSFFFLCVPRYVLYNSHVFCVV